MQYGNDRTKFRNTRYCGAGACVCLEFLKEI